MLRHTRTRRDLISFLDLLDRIGLLTWARLTHPFTGYFRGPVRSRFSGLLSCEGSLAWNGFAHWLWVVLHGRITQSLQLVRDSRV